MKVDITLLFDWKFILFMQLTVDILTIANIPIVRHIFCFIYLIFVIGFVPIKLLKLHKKITTLNTLLFAVGFSLAIIFFLTLFLNALLPTVGVYNSISLQPVMISLNCFTFASYLINYFVNKNKKMVNEHRILEFNPLIFSFFVLPLISIVGCLIVNVNGDNFLLLILILLICIFAIISFILSRKNKHFNLYPLILFAIAISLFLTSSSITKYIVGNDIYEEFHVFKNTANNLYWNSSMKTSSFSLGKANAMLSVTVLPAIFSMVTGLDGDFIFKFLYPFILSCVVLGLYELYHISFDRQITFLSVFFFITNNVVFWLFSCRQIVAELFYILLLITLLNRNLDASTKMIFKLAFSVSLVISHYSMTFIFLFLVVSAWLYCSIFKKEIGIIKFYDIVFIVVFSFLWYIYISSASTFNDLINSISWVYQNFFSDFFNLESRGSLTVNALGCGEIYTPWNMVGRLLFYLSEFFTGVGFIKIMVDMKKGKTSANRLEFFASMSFILIFICIVVPNFSNILQVNRFYQIALLLTAPLCIVGGRTLITLVSKRSKKLYAMILLCLFQIPFFLFQSGFVYTITGSPTWSIPLSYHKGDFDNPQLYNQIVYEQEVVAAQWLRRQMPVGNSIYNRRLIYADLLMCDHVLTAYGLFTPENMRVLTNVTIPSIGSYIYLGRLNTVKESFGGYKEFSSQRVSDFKQLLEKSNKIYSNGESEVYIYVP